MSEENVPTPDKMKVTELRKALSDRGLNPKGTKAVLVKQLFAAMHAEEVPGEDTVDAGKTEEGPGEDTVDAEETKTDEIEKKNAEEKEEEEKKKKETDEKNKKMEEEKAAKEKKEADKLAEEKNKREADLKEEEKIAKENQEKEKVAEEQKRKAEKVAEEKIAEEKKKKEEEEKVAEEKKKKEEEKIAEEKKKKEEEEKKKMAEEKIAEEKGDEDKVVLEKEETEKAKEGDDMKLDEVEPEKSKNVAVEETKEEMKEDVSTKSGVKYTKVVRTVYVRQKDEENEEEMKEVVEAKRGGTKRKMGEEENEEPNGKKRKVEIEEIEPEDKIEKKEPPFEIKEDEPEIDESLMSLDWYNSDLNLKIGDDRISGQPEHKKGWGYAYAGTRSTYGFNSGKVWYEVKFTEALDCSLEKEENRHDLRVGWSTDDASLQLGEDQLSWCYAGATGKMANNKTFEDYGEKIETGDIVGAYVDFEGDSVSVTFTRNGDDLGDAFQIPKADLGGRYLFPHILSKNVKFEVNFGSIDASINAWKEPLPGGYIKAAKSDNKIRGKPRIQKREDCELIMMVGLPASGKTTWVNKFLKENPYKNYNILGTSAILNKMTIEGKSRKEIHEGKWADILRVVTSCNQDMIELASKRRRNFIIDQPNVYANAQKKKVEPFIGFKRSAVVVVPTSKQHNERIESQEEKNFPIGVIEELRANLTLPKEDDTNFTEITFTELQREEAEKVVEQDKKVAKEKGYGKNKERKIKKNPGKVAVKTNARGRTAQRGQGNRRGGQAMRPQNYRGPQNNGGSPMWNNYWQDKHHGNLRNMAQAAGWMPNPQFRGNMGMAGGNMGARGNMRGQGMMGRPANMGGQMNMGPQRNMGGQTEQLRSQINMGPQWGVGRFNQGGNQPNPFSQNWSQAGGWRR